MKICFFGLGSIGRRHLVNLKYIADKKNIELHIHAYRKIAKPIDKEIEDLIEKTIFIEDELNDDYDIIFITNPTSLHFDTISLMGNKTKHMFIEKPLVDYKYYNFDSLNLNSTGVYYVAGPLKFSGVIQGMKNILVNEKVFSVRVICSSYLPDWRPNSDYRNIYSAKKDQGGGVCSDLIHEWDYITYLLGFPEEVKCIYGKYSNLEIDSEDLAVYIARYKDKLVEIHLDYFGRVPRRDIEIFTSSGTITGDLINNIIRFTDGRENINFRDDKNAIYLNEIEYFLENVLQGSRLDNIEHSRRVLALAKGRNE